MKSAKDKSIPETIEKSINNKTNQSNDSLTKIIDNHKSNTDSLLFSPLTIERSHTTNQKNFAMKDCNNHTTLMHQLNNLNEEVHLSKENVARINNSNQITLAKPYCYINKIELKGKEYHIKGKYESEEDYSEMQKSKNNLSITNCDIHYKEKQFSINHNENQTKAKSQEKTKEVLQLKCYQITKYRHLRNYRFSTNSFIRERASKKIQGWYIKFHKSKCEMIQKIQRVWRRKSKRKSMIELSNKALCLSIYEVMRKYVLRNYFSMLYLKRTEIIKKIIKIKYRQYLRRIREKILKVIIQEQKIIKLTKVRKFNSKHIELLCLYYHIWDIKVKHAIKQEDIQKEKQNELNKQASIIQIVLNMNNQCQREALKCLFFPLKKYMINQAFKIQVKVLLKVKKQLNQRTLIHYIHQWRRCIRETIYFLTKNSIKEKRLKGLIEHRHKLFIKKYFDIFKQRLISDLSIKLKNNNAHVIIPKLLSHLKNYAQIKGLENIKKYILDLRLKKIMNHILISQGKRYYYNKYRKNSKRLNSLLMFNKIMRRNYICSFRSKQTICLLKYFIKWGSLARERNICLLKFQKYKCLLYSIEKYIKTITLDNKHIFFTILCKYVHENSQRKYLIKIFGNNTHLIKGQRDRIFLYYFHKWTKSIVKSTLIEIKAKYINQTVNNLLNIIHTKALLNTFHRWKEINLLFKTQKEFNKHKRIIEGTFQIEKVKCIQMRKVISILSRPKEIYMKGKVLSNIREIILRRNNSLVKAYNIWKHINIIQQFRSINKKLTFKMHLKQLMTIKRNIMYKDKLLNLSKDLSKWYHRVIINESKDQNQFLKSLNDNIIKIQKITHDIYSKNPFNCIKLFKNYTKNYRIIKLKHYFQSNDMNNISLALKKWIRHCNNHKMLDIKGNRLYLTKKNIEGKLHHIKLLKIFIYWKLYHLYKYRYTCESLLNAFNHLNKGILIPVLSKSFIAIQTKSRTIAQDRISDIMFRRCKAIPKKLVISAFEKWKVITKKIDMKQFQSTVLSIVNTNEKGVMNRYIHKWISYSHQYPIRLNNIKQGGERLYYIMTKVNINAWDMLYNHVCFNYKTKALKAKVLPLSIFSYKQKIIQCFNQWRLHKEYSQFKDYIIKKFLKRKLLKNHINEVLLLKNSLIKWCILSKCLKPNIFGLSLSLAIIRKQSYYFKSILLRNIYIKPFLKQWSNQCKLITKNQIKQLNFNKIMIPLLRKVLRIKMKIVYNKWLILLYKGRDNDFKQKFMKCYINRKHHLNKILLLKQRQYQWNHFCHLVAYNKAQLIQFPIQITKLKAAISHYPNKISFKLLYDYSLMQLKHQRLTSIILKKNSEAFKRILRNAHRKWFRIVINRNNACNNIQRLINLTQEISSVKAAFNLIQLNKITSIALMNKNIKQSQSNIICNFTKGILDIYNQAFIMKRTITIRKRLNHLIKINQIIELSNLKKWNRKVNELQMNFNAKIIQSFLKKETQRIHDTIYKVKTLCNRIASILLDHNELLFNKFKYNCLQLPTKSIRENTINKQIIRVLRIKVKIESQMKTEKFKHWKKQIILIRQNQAGNTIIMNMKKYSSRKTVNYLKFKRNFLNKRLSILSKEDQSIAVSNWNKWRSLTYNFVLNNKATKIQLFLQERMKYITNLRILRRYNANISKGMKRLTETLETNALLSHQFKLFHRLHYKAKEQHIIYLCKHIPEKITQYHLNKSFNSWKLNTIIYTRRNIIKIQKWYKTHYSYHETFKKSYINAFIKKYFIKLNMNQTNSLSINLLHWRNQSLKIKMNNAIILIQKNIKGFLYRIKILSVITEANRLKIKNKEQLNRKSMLVMILVNKWVNPLTKYWIKLKTKNIHEEKKKLLSVLYTKRKEEEIMLILCLLRKWAKRTIQISTNDYCQVIQRYLYPKLKKIIHYKAINQIILLAQYIIKRKLNAIGKINYFRKLIIKLFLNKFCQGLKNNKKQLIVLHNLLMKKDTANKTYIKMTFNTLNENIIQTKHKSLDYQQGLSIVHHLLLKRGIHHIIYQSRRVLFSQMNNIITLHLHYIKRNSLNHLMNIRKALHLYEMIKALTNSTRSIIRHYYKQWEILNIHIKRQFSSKVIQKGFVNYLHRKHNKKIHSILNAIVFKTTMKYTSKVRYYFNIIRRKTLMLQLEENSNTIVSFIHYHYRNRIVRINWIKYLHKLILLNKKIEIRQISFKKKAIIFFDVLLKEQHKKWRFTLSYIKEHIQTQALNTISQRNILKNLRWNFFKWKSNDHYTYLLNTLNNKFIILGKSYKEAIKIEKSNSINKIYRLYIYKILSKIYSFLNEKMLHQNGHVFYRNFEGHIKSKALYTYKKSSTLIKIPVTYSFNLRLDHQRIKPNDYKRYFLILTPLFRNYLIKKMSKVNAYTFDKLLQESIPYNFAIHLRQFKQERMISHKKVLLKKIVFFHKQCTFDKLINKGIQIKLKEIFSALIKRKLLCILIMDTIISKTKTKHRVIKKVMGGWKYYVRMIIFKRKKLEEIENNFINTYEDLANELFSEGHPLQSSIPDELNSFYDKMNLKK